MRAWKKIFVLAVVLVLLANLGLGVYNAIDGQPWLGPFLSAAGLAALLFLLWLFNVRDSR